MTNYKEHRLITAAQLQPGDIVLLSNGDRTVRLLSRPWAEGSPVREWVWVYWTDGTTNAWLATGSVEVIR